MWQALKMFKESHLQTKLFVLTVALYLMTLVWTTVQCYARLEYSRTDPEKPILIQTPTDDAS